MKHEQNGLLIGGLLRADVERSTGYFLLFLPFEVLLLQIQDKLLLNMIHFKMDLMVALFR